MSRMAVSHQASFFLVYSIIGDGMGGTGRYLLGSRPIGRHGSGYRFSLLDSSPFRPEVTNQKTLKASCARLELNARARLFLSRANVPRDPV
jgi:hypothetical protein